MYQLCVVLCELREEILIFLRQKDITTLEWSPWELMSDSESEVESSEEESEDSDVEE